MAIRTLLALIVAAITLDASGAEICRFAAGDAADPFRRWFQSQDVVCAAPGTALPPGTWNVFARDAAALSDPVTVDGSAAMPELPLAPAATVTAQLPAGRSGALYVPRRAVAFPAAGRTLVPAGEELWLFVLERSAPVGVVIVPPLTAGSERGVDATNVSGSGDLLAWLQVPDADREAIRRARGVLAPRLSAGNREATVLPPAERLHGAFVLLRGLPAGQTALQFGGRGWLSFTRSVRVAPDRLTTAPDPLIARASARLVVNWSSSRDLDALDRTLGACQPPAAPQFTLTVSACPPPKRGEPLDPATCTPVRTENLPPQLTFGTLTIDEVTPRLYRAELRYGKLPPAAITFTLAPLQQQPSPLNASYVTTWGSLTRGGKPLGEDATIEFPGGGKGFAPGDSDEYHAVLTASIDDEATVDVTTCRGRRWTVAVDPPGRGRDDIDIPDNLLNVTVVDTFTHAAVPAPALRYTVLPKLLPRFGGPRRPLFTRTLKGEDGGAFALDAVPPEREVHLQVSSRGYKTQDVKPFSMSARERKDVEVQLVPLSGSEGRIVSARPFENGTVSWSSSAGVETERAELNPDGTFLFEHAHLREETMTVVSSSHPLWITRAPLAERGKVLQVGFPDAAPVRSAEVWIAGMPIRMITLVGVAIGGLRVPSAALARHLAARDVRPFVDGEGPLTLPAIAETAPIDILRGPTGPRAFVMPGTTRDFPPVAVKRLQKGVDSVAF